MTNAAYLCDAVTRAQQRQISRAFDKKSPELIGYNFLQYQYGDTFSRMIVASTNVDQL